MAEPVEDLKRPRWRFWSRALIVGLACIGALAFFAPSIYHFFNMRYCFEQIRRQNRTPVEPPDYGETDGGSSVENECSGVLVENRHRYLNHIMERIQDPNENEHLRESLLGLVNHYYSTLDSRPILPVCLKIVLDDQEPWEIRRSAASVLSSGGVETRRLLGTRAPDGRTYLDVVIERIGNPSENENSRRLLIRILAATGGLDDHRIVPLAFRLLLNEREDPGVRHSASGLLIDKGSAVQTEIRHFLDKDTGGGKQYRELAASVAEANRETHPEVSRVLDIILKSASDR